MLYPKPLFRVLILFFSVLLVALPAGAQATAVKMVHINTVDLEGTPPQVVAYASVLSENRDHLGGLAVSAFTIAEDGTPVDSPTIEETSPGLAIVIVIDRTASMLRKGIEEPTRLEDAKAKARQLVDKLHADDWVGMIGFTEDCDPVLDLTQDHGLVKNTVYQLEYVEGKGTALYDATYEALRMLTHNPDAEMRDRLAHTRKAIVIFSDGKDRASQNWTPTDIRDESEKADVPIYAVGMDSPPGDSPSAEFRSKYGECPLEDEHLKQIGPQTGGEYFHYQTPDDDAALVAFFDRLVSQRQQYKVRYPTHAEKGQHELRIMVSAGGASAEDVFTFYSPYEMPTVRLTEPAAGLELDWTKGLSVTLGAEFDFPDGLPRPVELVFFANDEEIHRATVEASPYSTVWTVPALPEGEAKYIDRQFSLRVELEDSVLTGHDPARSAPAAIKIKAPPPPIAPKRPVEWLSVIVIVLLIVAVVVLAIVLFKMRKQIGQGWTRTTTWVRRKTEMLVPGKAAAKLVIVHGANIGQEFRLTGRNHIVGRDENLCDFVIHDRFVSSRHATVYEDSGQYFIVDENSANGTWVNGVRIQPQQRMPITPGARIQMGETTLEFQRIGGTTKVLSTPGP